MKPLQFRLWSPPCTFGTTGRIISIPRSQSRDLNSGAAGTLVPIQAMLQLELDLECKKSSCKFRLEPQRIARNEYVPEGGSALAVLTLQKCSINVFAALAYAFTLRFPSEFGGCTEPILSVACSPVTANV
jgi:hypothetical protein